ncbi:transglutaminase-like domain-containing protein [Humidisolicoccus flavus]|uniref:transglutaminase-like domain-containing protein n=1 Tax=Humidisolicoccus flavus TaxID=3111414 RepID=UPI00324F2081
MRRVSATARATATGDTEFLVAMGAANSYQREEVLTVRWNDTFPPLQQESYEHLGCAVRFSTGAGGVEVEYSATIEHYADPLPMLLGETEMYLRPSRYCEVFELQSFVSERFGRASGWNAVDAVTNWVHRNFTYSPEFSGIDDSAISTLKKSGGMCRDYAHVTISLLRALGIPARYVSTFAPGLTPQDFHAVVEVFLDEAWWVVDATRLAPRGSLVRIATGRDALDCAFMSNTGAMIELNGLSVTASDDQLAEDAVDDPKQRVQLR